ncbi:aldehyde dehydrogenase (NAD+) [Fusarium phyllophilum]|uniref:Aldehyde dehydrogenase (NAD+) n=1 Tax=Fusarium phyllophilum TaxID=47803 RepID=A0A8H5IVA4_9HYPO|nr:aldehyde dehydrogenase (NAD+) [Fusarium phyllophilum]
MACCYIAAFCISQLVKVYQFLDVDDAIQYNEDESEFSSPGTKFSKSEYTKCDKDNASLILSLSGLTCSACSSAVESALASHPDVDQVRVSLALQQATLIGKTSSFDSQSIIRLVTDLGYGVELGPRSPQEVIRVLKSIEEIARFKSSLSSLAGCATVNQTVTFFLSVVQGRIPSAVLLAAHLLCAALTLFAQWQYILWIHEDGWKAICGGQPNMNTLVSSSIYLGTFISGIDLLAYGTTEGCSYYTTVLGLALVVVAGRYIELMSRRTTSEDLLRVYKPLTQSNYTKLHPTGKDAVREDAEKTIEQLHGMCYATHLLTGDMPQSANCISQRLKLPVLASEATPQDKLDLVKRLRKEGKEVAMVGDGLNDGLSLAAADVGIALYHDVLGLTTPTVSATLFILNSRLDSIPLLLEIAEMTIKQIRINFKGDFVQIIDGQSAPTKETRHGVNPANLQEMAKVPVATQQDLDRAVAAAKKAFKTWSKTPYEERRVSSLARLCRLA